MAQVPNDELIRSILKEAKTIAVVGLSNNPQRDSYRVAQYLQKHDYRIIPVNPSVDEVLGQKAFNSLSEITEDIDIVDIFRRSEAVPDVVEDALRTSAKTIWMQLGIVNEAAAENAEKAGKTVIMDRCIKIDHARLM